MERNKLKMKYLLGVWKDLPGYPKEEDLIYELNSYLLKDGRPDGEFTEQTFNSFLPSDWKKSRHGEIIKDLIERGEIEKTEKTSGSKEWYKIANNPHY